MSLWLLVVGIVGVPVSLRAQTSASAATSTHHIRNNEINMPNAPMWVTLPRVEKVLHHIQMVLSWDIRRINVYFDKDEATFDKAQPYGDKVIAVSLRKDNSIHLGPKVTDKNFDGVFGHELVHIISFQKYKGAFPAWLEEGLANYLSKARTVSYKFLKKHPFPKDVRQLVHPVSGSSTNIQYNYQASQALAEMIASKCDLHVLFDLSVGRKLDNYLDTYCEIHDLNKDFQKWVRAH